MDLLSGHSNNQLNYTINKLIMDGNARCSSEIVENRIQSDLGYKITIFNQNTTGNPAGEIYNN